MTGTLIQLRRVVYLLVLLQCFACVVNGASGRRTSDALINEMNGLGTEMDALSKEITERRGSMTSEMSLCENSKSRTKTLATEVGKLAEEMGDGLAAGSAEEKLGKVAAKIQETNMAVKETREVVARTRAAVKNTSAVVNKFVNVYNKYLSSWNEYMALYYVIGVGPYDARKYKVAGTGKGNLKTAIEVITNANEHSKSVWQCAAEAEEAADIAGNATARLSERMKGTPSPPGGPTARQPSGELSDISPTGGVKDASDQKAASVGAGKNSGPGEGSKRQEDNEAIRPATDDAAKRGSVDVAHNKEERVAGKSNTEGRVSAPSANADFEPHQLLSVSLPSGPLDSNVTRLSDGSSSPALVRSPLLLLVLMCVMGSILVC